MTARAVRRGVLRLALLAAGELFAGQSHATHPAPQRSAVTNPTPPAATPAPVQGNVSWSEPSEPAEASARARPPAPYTLKWYGWQTLGVDGLAVLALVAAAGTEKPVIALLAIPLYFVVPPVIHEGHDRPAWPSLMLRIGLPLGGGLFALKASSTCRSSDDNGEPTFCEFVWSLAGVGVGMLAASILDASIFAYEHADKRHAGVRVAPRLELGGGRAVLGASWAF